MHASANIAERAPNRFHGCADLTHTQIITHKSRPGQTGKYTRNTNTPDGQDAKHGDVQCKHAQEAVLLSSQALSGQLVDEDGDEVAHHGSATVQLLSLFQTRKVRWNG